MYNKKTWTARQGTGLNKFRDTISGNNLVLVNTPDSVSVPGDAFSVENMNDLEERIEAGIKDTAPYKIYGVRIDTTNSNPETSVVYTDDAVGLTPSAGNNGSYAGGSWDDIFPFNCIKPCLLKNGNVVGYLNPSNFAQFADGTAADITSGDAGDVMIEFPYLTYKIYKEGNYIYCKISTTLNGGFTDRAFNYNGATKEKFYIGAYKGYYDGTKLRSLSGKTPTVSQTIGTFRNYARANGSGYEQTGFAQLVLRQVLYLIKFKSLNSQAALGAGYTSGSASVDTGATDANGMYYGQTSGTSRVKCFGIEDFWGNVWEWVDGYMQKNYKLLVATGNYNNTGSGYAEVGDIPANISGYIKSIRANNDLGFVITDGSGSSGTYFCDYSDCDASAGVLVPDFGGDWISGSRAGAFLLLCINGVGGAGVNVGARLAFCG